MNNVPYKESFEYAFDILDHFYGIHKNMILIIGEANLIIYFPAELFALLKMVNKKTGDVSFLHQFKGIDIELYSGSKVIFGLKEIKNNGN